jgi:putative flavoprotein involved in K+ transport
MNAAVQLVREARAAAGTERFDVIVIGGGQAGLSVGYYLARQGVRFLILDAHERVGDAWRKRWDSLRLFSPARFDALVGMPFPAPADSFPTRAEMADYLEAYAKRFQLPVRNNARVDALTERDGRYHITCGEQEFEADQVIIAMSNYQKPRTPELAGRLAPGILQLHSSEYRNAAQLRDGPVLVAGVGNSGAEIAHDLARSGREVWLSGKPNGEVPFRMDSWFARWFAVRLLFRVFFHRVLTVRTPMGRKARPKMLKHATPLIRTRLPELVAQGVRSVPRVTGAKDGKPELQDGQVLDVNNVIWCTGFHPGFSWLKLPVLDESGAAEHDAGIVPSHPGLCFVGLNFLYSASSSMIHGVGRDAERITRHLAQVRRANAKK